MWFSCCRFLLWGNACVRTCLKASSKLIACLCLLVLRPQYVIYMQLIHIASLTNPETSVFGYMVLHVHMYIHICNHVWTMVWKQQQFIYSVQRFHYFSRSVYCISWCYGTTCICIYVYATHSHIYVHMCAHIQYACHASAPESCPAMADVPIPGVFN